MPNKTKIEWTERTWSPVTGCSKISEGCANCYASAMTRRFWKQWGCEAPPNHFVVKLHPERLEEPLRIKKPTVFFVCSMADLFHEDVPDEFIDQVFAVMALCPQHTFQILTKRPQRMLKYCSQYREQQIRSIWSDIGLYAQTNPSVMRYVQVLPNVWLGVSAENQRTADERIPLLLQTPAALRFVSCEPLISKIDLCHEWGAFQDGNNTPFRKKIINGLDLCLCGAETGQKARPCHPDWVRSLRDQCQSSGTPFFLKKCSDGTHQIDGKEYREMPRREK